MRRRWGVIISCCVLMAFSAQAEEPHIGYCFPMGGQQNTSFDALIGGQFLMGDAQSYVNGDGVSIEVLDYYKEVDQKSFGQMKRRKKNLEAQIKELKDKGENTTRLDIQMEKVLEAIAVQEKALSEMTAKYTRLEIREIRKKKQFNPQIAELLKVRVTIAKNAPDGERELRVRTAKGLSNPIVFRVGTLDEVVEQEPNDNNHAENLQQVTLPVLINGQVMPGDIDCFRFKALKGQSLVIDVRARRLIPYLADAVPGWFQAVVALYDENGDEVALADDYKLSPDPVLFYEVPRNGTYTLEIKDSIYRGREDFIYRISAGELPFITSLFPLGSRETKEVNIVLVGKNLPKDRLNGRLPETGYSEVRQISVRKGPHQSNALPFMISTLPEVFEREPNNTVETSQQLRLPMIVNGRIQEPGDRDVFSFAGRAGDSFSIEVTARRLNSPLDSIIRLTGPGIDDPVQSDDYVSTGTSHLFLGAGLTTHHADSYLLYKLTESGVFSLDIGDTQMKGGYDFSYRLRLSPARPDFTLRMEPSGLNIAPGGTAVFTVHTQRKDGFDEKIVLDAENLPDGFVMSKSTIAAGADSVRFTLTAPRDLKPMKVAPEIKGMGIINGKPVERKAVPVDDQMQAFLYRHLVPSQELVLSPSEKVSPVSFEVVVPKTGVVVLPINKEVRLNIKGMFSNEMKGNGANLELDHPPAGFSVVKGWLGRDKKSGNKKGHGKNKAGGSIVLLVDDSVKPGFKTSLVVNAVVKRGREQFIYPSPAIQVKVVADE